METATIERKDEAAAVADDVGVGEPISPVEQPLVMYVEQFRCPRCESALPSECVQGKGETHPQTLRMTRVVSIYCPHCNVGFRGVFGLRDGQLVPLAPAERLDPRRPGR
jgi:hypothetical protein